MSASKIRIRNKDREDRCSLRRQTSAAVNISRAILLFSFYLKAIIFKKPSIIAHMSTAANNTPTQSSKRQALRFPLSHYYRRTQASPEAPVSFSWSFYRWTSYCYLHLQLLPRHKHKHKISKSKLKRKQGTWLSQARKNFWRREKQKTMGPSWFSLWLRACNHVRLFWSWSNRIKKKFLLL